MNDATQTDEELLEVLKLACLPYFPLLPPLANEFFIIRSQYSFFIALPVIFFC